MKKLIFSYLLLFLTLFPSTAQQHLVDSIRRELMQPMADENRSMSLMRLAIDYETVDTTSAYKAYRDAIKFAAGKKLYYQLGRIYQNQSFLFSTAGKYSKTKSSLDSAILSYQKSNHPSARLWEANAYGDMANVFKVQNDFEESVRYNLKSISLLEKLDLSDNLVVRYCNLSGLFGDLGEYIKQEDYARKAVEIAEKTRKKGSLFISYFMLSHSLTHLDKNDEAKIYIDSAKIYIDLNSNVDIIFSYYLITGEVFKKLNDLDSADKYFQKCYSVSERNNYNYGKAESLLQLGGVSILQKKYGDAEHYLLEGIKLSEDIHYFNMLQVGYKYLSDIYAATGRYKPAYEYFQMYKEISDSAVTIESKKYATTLEKKYESEKKDIQLKLQKTQLQKEKILVYILLGGAISILLVSLLVYRTHQQKQKLQQQKISELETQQLLTATEAVLKGEDQERTRLAKDLHDGLGGILSGIKFSFTSIKGNILMTPENAQAFERSLDMLDCSIQEMRRVAHNLMPEVLVKFGLDTALKDFCNEINNSGALKISYQPIGLENVIFDQTTAITIYRIVQELINNTMKHAGATNLIVQIAKTDHQINITVEDDGKGFDTAILRHSRGIGWNNIQNRVELLKGNLNVQSSPVTGTSAHIEIDIP